MLSPLSVALPSRIGPYEIVGELGRGGMGMVYLARDPRLRRDVALKMLHGSAIADPGHCERLLAEACATSTLSHPNIVAVYDVATDTRAPYIVTELIDGEPLRRAIDQGAMALPRVLDIAVQIADGLAAAHQAGLVHRDLTPENVMVTRDGRVKILDFGLAVAVSDSPRVGSETVPQAVVGTAAYMSPELARGGAFDFRSDLFSFGAIVHEMITGRRVFAGATDIETLVAVLHDEPPVPHSPAGRVPALLQRIVRRCLQKAPGQRYAATADLLHDLRIVRDELASLGRDSAPQAAATDEADRARRFGTRTLATRCSTAIAEWQSPGPWRAAWLVALVTIGAALVAARTRRG